MSDQTNDATRAAQTTDNQDERFDVVNEADEVIGQTRRSEAHRNPWLIHRSVQALIFNHAGELLLQRRSASKDLFPGYWCASASGHVASGDDYATTAAREVGEELGVALDLACLGKATVRTAMETEITAVFVGRHDGPFHFNPVETQGGAFYSLAAIVRGRGDGSLPLTPAFLAALDLYLATAPHAASDTTPDATPNATSPAAR
jgi:isopentenyldiphosphate isomerase